MKERGDREEWECVERKAQIRRLPRSKKRNERVKSDIRFNILTSAMNETWFREF